MNKQTEDAAIATSQAAGHNVFRFVQFRALVTLRVPWDEAADPLAAYSSLAEAVMNDGTGAADRVWDIQLSAGPWRTDQASDLKQR